MVDAEQNLEETPRTPTEDQSPSKPSALEVLDRIEAEKAADAAGPKPGKAVEAVPAKTGEPQPEKVDELKAEKADESEDKSDDEPKLDPDSKEARVARLKKNLARCDELKAEVNTHKKAIEELNRERSRLTRDIKHDREFTRPPLHELNRQQAQITKDERAARYEALEAMRQLGLQPGANAVTRKPGNPHPPKFKV